MYVAVDLPSATLVTPTTTPASILPGSQRRWVHAIEIYVRDLGTATYVRIGDSISQERTLAANGASSVYEAPNGGVIDAASLFVVSDANDAVLEITLLDSRVKDHEVRRD